MFISPSHANPLSPSLPLPPLSLSSPSCPSPSPLPLPLPLPLPSLPPLLFFSSQVLAYALFIFCVTVNGIYSYDGPAHKGLKPKVSKRERERGREMRRREGREEERRGGGGEGRRGGEEERRRGEDLLVEYSWPRSCTLTSQERTARSSC